MPMYEVDFANPQGGYVHKPVIGLLDAAAAGAPTASAAGYAKGCIYRDTANGVVYVNSGSVTSATWVVVGQSGGTVPAATITALTYGSISDGTTTQLATALELNRIADLSTRVVALTPTAAQTITLDDATYSDKIILITTTTVSFNLAIPAFAGTGGRKRVIFGGTLSSATVTITATGAHLFGAVQQNTDTANGSSGFTTGQINAGGSTIITVDGTTKGGRKGDWIEIEDVAAAHGQIKGCLNASGSEATPFS